MGFFFSFAAFVQNVFLLIEMRGSGCASRIFIKSCEAPDDGLSMFVNRFGHKGPRPEARPPRSTGEFCPGGGFFPLLCWERKEMKNDRSSAEKHPA